MTRSDFQQLAQVRINEAAVLLAASKWDGAYYLAGYAVECALKACIAKLTKAEDFPPKKKVVEDCYSHDLNTLLKAAGLTAARDADFRTFEQIATAAAGLTEGTLQLLLEQQTDKLPQ
ncbi:MAG: DNA-binding protein, partial [Planctomycetia bacterium]|nr:DNA-binding protein [Planctomycetia bacterium]